MPGNRSNCECFLDAAVGNRISVEKSRFFARGVLYESR